MTKGRKRTKGVPDLHDELKTRVNLSLTPKAVEGLDTRATELLLSRSELVERIGRGLIPIAQIPSISFSERHKLPDRPGIGLVVSGSQILYVGQGIELKRLTPSSLVKGDVSDDQISLIWIECNKPSWLPLIETALVATYKPRSQIHQSRIVEEADFSKWLDSDVLQHLTLETLLGFHYACLEALIFRGAIPENDTLDRNIPDSDIPDTTTIGDGVVLTNLFSYIPPHRWMKSSNGGMYDVHRALLDDDELHELPEDLQQRVMERRLEKTAPSTVESETREEESQEVCKTES
jgi:hypothetical protein